jgi:trehalose utilization protein
MSREPRIVVWNEFRHERENPAVRRIYPDGGVVTGTCSDSQFA